MVRGAYYLVADGSYAGKTFSQATSGTTLITVRKATTTDHGTETGWSSAFGDGQAAWTGVLGGANCLTVACWTVGHGFKITETTSNPAIFINSDLGSDAGNITVRHAEVTGNLSIDGGTGNDGIQVWSPALPNTFEYLYIHDMGRCIVYVNTNATNVSTFSYIYTGKYAYTAGEHSELITLHGTAKVVWRYGVIRYIIGTGGFVPHDTSSATQLDFYGNVLYPDAAMGSWDTGINGYFATDSGGPGGNIFKIYNNTFINVPDGPIFGEGVFGKFVSSVIQNNYFYLTTATGSTSFTHSFNHYQNSGAGNGTNITTGTGVPFVAYTTLDFHLLAATTAGTTLASPYNLDMFGITRGASGAWDRGAIEFCSGGC